MSTPPQSPFNVQIAVKCSLDVFFFDAQCLLHVLLDSSQGPMDQNSLAQIWNSMPIKNSFSIQSDSLSNQEQLKSVFEANSLLLCASDATSSTFSGTTLNKIPVVAKITLVTGTLSVECCTPVPQLNPLFQECVQFFLSKNA